MSRKNGCKFMNLYAVTVLDERSVLLYDSREHAENHLGDLTTHTEISHEVFSPHNIPFNFKSLDYRGAVFPGSEISLESEIFQSEEIELIDSNDREPDLISEAMEENGLDETSVQNPANEEAPKKKNKRASKKDKKDNQNDG